MTNLKSLKLLTPTVLRGILKRTLSSKDSGPDGWIERQSGDWMDSINIASSLLSINVLDISYGLLDYGAYFLAGLIFWPHFEEKSTGLGSHQSRQQLSMYSVLLWMYIQNNSLKKGQKNITILGPGR